MSILPLKVHIAIEILPLAAEYCLLFSLVLS